jgi:hypothetical protein
MKKEIMVIAIVVLIVIVVTVFMYLKYGLDEAKEMAPLVNPPA